MSFGVVAIVAYGIDELLSLEGFNVIGEAELDVIGFDFVAHE